MKDGTRLVHLTAQFDTQVDYYGDEDGSAAEAPPINPENALVCTWVETLDWDAYLKRRQALFGKRRNVISGLGNEQPEPSLEGEERKP